MLEALGRGGQPPRTIGPPRWPRTTATTGNVACRRRSSAGPVAPRRSGCTSPTATRSTCGSGSRTARVRTGLRQLENNRAPYDLDGRWIGEATFELPADLPIGYHRLHLQVGSFDTSTTLIVSPASLELPPRLGARRAWGLATQLYSVRSRKILGHRRSDRPDRSRGVVGRASTAPGFILVNPLHAAAPTAPMEPSPYLPTSRRFVNPLYLRVEAIPEFAYVRHRGRIRKARANVQARADRSELIDRDAAWAGQAGRAGKRLPGGAVGGPRAGLRRLPRPRGPQPATTSPPGVRWPRSTAATGISGRRRCSTRRTPRSRSSPPSTPTTSTSIAGCSGSSTTSSPRRSRRRVAAGMALGIMHDLAVGVDPERRRRVGDAGRAGPGRHGRRTARRVQPARAGLVAAAAGGPTGWSSRPMSRSAPCVSAVLRHAGGIRIDHIIGLFRLWWIPKGSPPTEGTYVRYDHEAMIGIVALEAHRAGAVVVGEDLGTVEPWVRDYLRERGLLGTSILWFELDRDGDGGPLQAHRWREYCLSAVTTHDLPPTAGYLAGEHVRLRERARAADPPGRRGAGRRSGRTGRVAGRTAPGRACSARRPRRRAGRARRCTNTSAARRRSCWRCRWPTPWAIVRTQNQPGTTDEYPNWRVPLSRPATAGDCCSRTCSLTRGRPRWPRSMRAQVQRPE